MSNEKHLILGPDRKLPFIPSMKSVSQDALHVTPLCLRRMGTELRFNLTLSPYIPTKVFHAA
jgi:hypothetical protein